MKLLGIDYGIKRIGLAISDDNGKVAFPFKIIDNPGDLNKIADQISQIVDSEKIEKIIIGESKDFKMKENPIMTEINDLIGIMSLTLGLPIDLQSEFMTSSQISKETFQAKKIDRASGKKRSGNRAPNKKENIDDKAATLILQSYIDSGK